LSLSECVINTNAYQDEATDAERIRLEFKALIQAWLAGIDLVLEEAGDDEEVLAQLKANAAQSDRKIVEVASDRKWIIVTANGGDFIAEIRRYELLELWSAVSSAATVGRNVCAVAVGRSGGIS
jgi:hypothetical protein